PLPAKRPALPRECNGNIPESKKSDASSEIASSVSPNPVGYQTSATPLGVIQGQVAWVPPSLGKLPSPASGFVPHMSLDLNLLTAMNMVPSDPIYRTHCTSPQQNFQILRLTGLH
ncbi:hypothetical protein Ciccas_006964, partial [Cichlidogyrus casuarinus]